MSSFLSQILFRGLFGRQSSNLSSVVGGCFFYALQALGYPTLLIQISDMHSEVPMMQPWLKHLDLQIQSHCQKVPECQVVILAGGDIAGTSPGALVDYGQLTYDMLAILAQDPRISVVIVQGNHEAFDFNSAILQDDDNKPINLTGDQLYYRQLIRYQHQVKGTASPGQVITANAKVAPEFSDLFGPFWTFGVKDTNVAVIGLASNETLPKSSTSAQKVFLQITPNQEIVLEQLESIRAQGILHAIVVAHEGYEHFATLEAVLREFVENESANRPPSERMNILLLSGAHDHRVYSSRVGSSQFLSLKSGARYAYSAVAIPDSLVPSQVTHHFFDRASVRSASASILSDQIASEAIKQAVKLVEDFKGQVGMEGLIEVVGHLPYQWEAREESKLRQTQLGKDVSDALRIWIQEQLPMVSQEQIVTLYNSGGIRNEDPIGPGLITRWDALEVSAFHEFTSIFTLTGAEVQAITSALKGSLRQYAYTPQMASHLRLQEDTARGVILQIKGKDGVYRELDSNKIYYFSVDAYLANAVSLRPWLQGRELPGIALNTQKLMSEYLPRVIQERKLSCVGRLLGW